MLRLEARAEPSQLMSYASPLLAIVLMLIGGLILFSALGKDPVEGFRIFFISPLSDIYGVSELFLKATPLMLVAIGLAVGFRANVWNIGAEGQYIMGGVAASAVALYFYEAEGPHILFLMVLAGSVGGIGSCIFKDTFQYQRNPGFTNAGLRGAIGGLLAGARSDDGSGWIQFSAVAHV